MKTLTQGKETSKKACRQWCNNFVNKEWKLIKCSWKWRERYRCLNIYLYLYAYLVIHIQTSAYYNPGGEQDIALSSIKTHPSENNSNFKKHRAGRNYFSQNHIPPSLYAATELSS